MGKTRVGVYICHCGVNIKSTVDVSRLARFAATLPHVAVAKNYMYMCSEPGQEMIRNDIKELGLNRVVVAACSPRMHEPTFRKALGKARPESLLPGDGQHPRALRLGARGHGRRPPKSQSVLAGSRGPRPACWSRWRKKKLTWCPRPWSSAAASPASRQPWISPTCGFKVYLVEKEPTSAGT